MTIHITIFGTGYVGLVTGVCFANAGHQVTCVDIDQEKLQQLHQGKSYFYEPGMEEILGKNIEAGRISFTDDAKKALKDADFVFIAVGTPESPDGSANLNYVFTAAETIGKYLNKPAIIINKSTVPVGTGTKVESIIANQLEKRNANIAFTVASNPEFLKQGDAIRDFFEADRVVIGANDPNTIAEIRKLYQSFKGKIVEMDRNSAELTKYAANAFLASRISFMNEIAAIAEKVDANIDYIREGIGTDPRVGPYFLRAGCGYGGSCFPKDVKALQHTSIVHDVSSQLLNAIDLVNKKQKHLLFNRINAKFNQNLRGKTIAVWGLAFKPNTDDMREAPSRTLMESLWNAGAKVQAYDPVAHKTALKIYGQRDDLIICTTSIEALKNADALAIVTEWQEFCEFDPKLLKQHLKNPIVFDGRNIYAPQEMLELEIDYTSIGR